MPSRGGNLSTCSILPSLHEEKAQSERTPSQIWQRLDAIAARRNMHGRYYYPHEGHKGTNAYDKEARQMHEHLPGRETKIQSTRKEPQFVQTIQKHRSSSKDIPRRGGQQTLTSWVFPAGTIARLKAHILPITPTSRLGTMPSPR